MKKRKKIIPVFLFTILLITGASLLSSCGQSGDATRTFEDYEYSVEDQSAVITGYSGTGQTLVIPDKMDKYPVAEIGREAFSDCDTLISVALPNGLKTVSRYAFAGCASLSSVIVPESVIDINYRAFADCISLASVTLPAGLQKLGAEAFANCTALSSIVLPEGLQYILDKTFKGCVSLRSVTFPKSLTRIYDAAFSGCASLHAVEFPANLQRIDQGAFENCIALEAITLPGSLKTVADDAFSGCSSLATVVFPEQFSNIEDETLRYCCNLIPVQQETIWGDTFTFRIVPGGAQITEYDGRERNLVIPDTLGGYPVTEISSHAFSRTNSFISASLPESIQHIPDNAFTSCKSLASVELPAGLISIGSEAFRGCDSLTSVSLPETLEVIGDMAFIDCGNLQSVRVPVTIAMMGKDVFGDAIKIADMDIYGDAVDFDTLPDDTVWTADTLAIRLGSELAAFVPAQPDKTLCLLVIDNDSQLLQDSELRMICEADTGQLQAYLENIKRQLVEQSGNKLSFTSNPDKASVLLLLQVEYIYWGMAGVGSSDTGYFVSSAATKRAYHCQTKLTATDMRKHENFSLIIQTNNLEEGAQNSWIETENGIYARDPGMNTDKAQALVQMILKRNGIADDTD